MSSTRIAATNPAPVWSAADSAASPIVTSTSASHTSTGAPPAEPEASAQRARASRSPQNAQRLALLRTELSKIEPKPCSPEQARDAILAAMRRASLGDWTVHALDDESTQRSKDGSYRIKLLSHEILLNPSGAFRIVDLHAPSRPYFELSGCKGGAFLKPPDF